MIWNPSPRSSPGNPKGSQPDGGAEAITVTLRRRPGDGADKLNQTANSTSATDLRNLLDTLEGENRKGMADRRFTAGYYSDSHEKRRELCLHADL